MQEIKDEVMKQVDEDNRRSQTIVDMDVLFVNASKAKTIKLMRILAFLNNVFFYPLFLTFL